MNFRRGVLLHDIGNITLPDSLFYKKEALNGADWELIRQHPVNAYEMLYPITYLRCAVDIPYCHHERWDGSGYPRGLSADNIPLSARIFSVVDVYYSLQAERPYRPAWTQSAALDFIRANTGIQFDPQVVGSFLRLING